MTIEVRAARGRRNTAHYARTVISTGASDPWPVMTATSREVLREILVNGPLPRAELAARLGLSKPTLTRVTRTLVDDGFLREGGTELRGGMGRPSELLHLVPTARHFVGVKLTGTHLYAVVSDLGATVIDTYDEPIVDRSVAAVVAQIARVAEVFGVAHGPMSAIGVALAGTVSGPPENRLVHESAFLEWRDVSLSTLLEAATGLPASVDNDVQALTATEHWFGAGAGLDSMVLITVGVGIGCGIVVNNRLVSGARGMPGHISHVIVNPSGPYCDRGHRGCASSYLPNRSIAASLPREWGEQTYESALEQARAGRPAAVQAFADAGFALGALIGTAANLVDPAKVILSGDGIAVYDLAADDVRRGIEHTYESAASDLIVDVQPFDFGEWARGGAVLAIRTAIDV